MTFAGNHCSLTTGERSATPLPHRRAGWRLFLLVFFFVVFMAYTACQMPLR